MNNLSGVPAGGAAGSGAGGDVSSVDGIGDGFAGADVVVLALPYAAAEEVAAAYRDELAGKVVVDISNPVDFATFDSLVVPAGTSAAELIAAVAPGARVFIAGDDADAKQAVADLAASGGLRPVDAGALKRARELEGFQFLHMTLQEVLGTSWSSAIKIVG